MSKRRAHLNPAVKTLKLIEVYLVMDELWTVEEWDMVENWLDFIRANEFSHLGKAERRQP